MATHTAYVFADQESSSIIGYSLGSTSTRITLGDGDTLSVNHSNSSPNSAGAATISGFSTSSWTSASDLSVSRGSTGSRDVKTNPTASTYDLTVSISGYGTVTIYVEVVSSVDSEPDDFSSALSDITNANPSQEYYLGRFQVQGINTPVTLSVSGTAGTESRVFTYGTKSSGAKTVQNAHYVYIWGTSPSSYDSSTTATIQVGTRVVNKTVSTAVDPQTGARIPFPVSSGAISMNDVRGFFGPVSSTASLGDYYRGGTYVIDVTTGSPNNSEVPASGTISLDDFYNAFTTIYFSTAPANKSAEVNTVSGAQSVTLNWSKATDWEVGFGPDMEDSAEYRLVHTTDSFSEIVGDITEYDITFGGVTRDLTVTSNQSTNYGSWTAAASTGSILIDFTADGQSECFVSGTIRLQLRHKDYTAYTTSAYFDYTISSWSV